MQPDAEHFADIVASAIRTSMAPLLSRITALEKRADVLPRDGTNGTPGEMGPQGPPGKDADTAALLAIKSEMASLRADWMTKSVELQPVELPDISALVATEVNRVVAALPPAPQGEPGPAGHDGLSVTVDDLAPLVRVEVQRAMDGISPPEKGEPGEPGRSVDSSEVEAIVAKAVDALPKPQDGRSVTLEDIEPLVQTVVTKAVEALPKARDGIGVVSALVDRDGHLVQTFSDGSTKDVGVVVGRDADPAEMARVIAEEVAKIPRPKDGRDGTLESLKLADVDDETVQFQFKDGTPIEGGTVRIPGFRDKGVWRPDETYSKGNAATFGGSLFIAQRDDPGKPEVGNGWRLAVKRGRDGMNGKNVQTVAPVVKVK